MIRRANIKPHHSPAGGRSGRQKAFGVDSSSGLAKFQKRISASMIQRILICLSVAILAILGIRRLTKVPVPTTRYPYQPALRNQKQSNKDVDVPELKYIIPQELVRKGQIPLSTRDYSNELISITDKNGIQQESYISLEAFREYGDEIRLLMQMGGEVLSLNNMNEDNKSQLAFRKRFHARAPWLKGNPLIDPDWPMSTLPKPIPNSKAIMICAGNPQLAYLKTLVHSIRVIHNSQIPIRIVFRDEKDLTPKSRQVILDSLPEQQQSAHNIQFVDLSQWFNLDAAQLKAGWNLKPFGLLAVAETQVVSLDVDVLLLQPPEALFLLQGYQQTGALFFHDRLYLNYKGFYDPGVLAAALQPNLSKTAQDIIHYGKTDYIAEHVMEAGLTMLDKSRRMLGVWAICLLMGRTDFRRYTQAFYIYGDKELYWIGLEIVSEPYALAKYFPGAYGSLLTKFDLGLSDVFVYPEDDETKIAKELERAQKDDRFALCGRMVHFDDTGRPLWSNGGYFTEEDEDWASPSKWIEQPLNPIWYVDGGLWTEEEFLPSVPEPPAQPNWLQSWYTLPHNPDAFDTLQHAHNDWDEALKKKTRLNQHWISHGRRRVMCLLPNARGIRSVPKDVSMWGLKAVQRFFLVDVQKKEYEKFASLWN
ncbi:Putative alpha-1,3-mannosyltransferase [Seminavis robusta]|uniref:Alpha-1,3-mannosyltransferase n=1 Tax=Seminavis robusta TaxID=568900 RepID=A0A9N8EHY0_9STRA|nr:Putative alpha-1,3-mannosyltransferase [Seminavis robusta]|eukprot:Sro1127_g244220.1 Putative alpha-1,3-mannosyltransferase (647) ;mRNA; f:24388-26328